MDGFFSQLPYKCHLFDTNATLKRWHLWEIDLRFALNSTPGWGGGRILAGRRTLEVRMIFCRSSGPCVGLPYQLGGDNISVLKKAHSPG